MRGLKRLLGLSAMFAVVALLLVCGAPPPAAAASVKCQPDEVAVWSNRIHVRCEAAVAGISYFVVPVSDAAHAARMLSLISSALVAGRSMFLTYEPSDTSGAAIGCAVNNCRLLQAATFGK